MKFTQQMFCFRSRNYPEWFETPRDELSCKEVPAVVNAGRPPGDVCLAVSFQYIEVI